MLPLNRKIPSPAAQEPTPKRRKLKPKKGGKARRRRALRNMPSDVWAAVFGQLPAMARELPGLRLVCRQVPPERQSHTIPLMFIARWPTCCSLCAEPLRSDCSVVHLPDVSHSCFDAASLRLLTMADIEPLE
jgi:hypothetical protein